MERRRHWVRRAGWLAGLACLSFVPVHAAAPAAEGRPEAAAGVDASDELFSQRAGIPRLQIDIPPDGMAVLRQYHWRRNGENAPRTDVRVTVREGKMVYTNVALHLKGSAGSFRPIDSDKPALTLNFDKFAGGQRFHGLQKLHLNNSVQDPSYLSEQICRELCLQAGLPTPRAAHAVVELNGDSPQLYVLVEGWNKQFLKRHFKNPKGNLYDSGAARDITFPLEINSGEHPEDRSRLEELAAAAQDPADETRFARIEKLLDLERFLTFIAMEVIMAHWDGYAMNRNNYRVFHDLDSDRLVFLPHGMDQMFGTWRSTPTSTITPMMKGIVARAVMQSPELRRRYLDRIAFLATNVFDVPALTNRVRQLSTRVQPALGGDFSQLAGQDRSAQWLCERIAARLASVREQVRQANTPLPFDEHHSARLANWRFSRDAGSPSFNRREDTQENLQITANGNYAYGSWRTQVLLEQGDYQFTGRLRTTALMIDEGVTRGGVTLRASGDRNPRMLSEAPDWTTFTYEFTVGGLTDIELVCELRASRGSVWFEADSLKLMRKTTPPRR
jgi:spore coat protein CotH